VRARWLDVGAHGVAIGWLAVLAVWLAPGVEAPEQRARVRPVPLAVEPTAAPEPGEPAPRAAATPPPAEPVAAPRPGDLARGDALLDGSGTFPALSASYEGLRSFTAYADAMQRLGARFVVVRQRAIAGEIDPVSGAIREGAPGAGFSPRARDYSGEPALATASARARARYGADAVVMMLVPRSLDAGLFGGIARALAERGDGVGEFRELSGRYERGLDGALQLRVESGVRRDGTRQSLPLLFDLGAISRSASPEPRA
jgi:hypothetical protein